MELYKLWRQYEKTNALRTELVSLKLPDLPAALCSKPKGFLQNVTLKNSSTIISNFMVVQSLWRSLKQDETRVHLLEKAKQTLLSRELMPSAKLAVFLSEQILKFKEGGTDKTDKTVKTVKTATPASVPSSSNGSRAGSGSGARRAAKDDQRR